MYCLNEHYCGGCEFSDKFVLTQ